MKKTTPIRDYMSHLPEEIDRREGVASAIERMKARHIRHLPVMDGPRIFGILSREDVQDAWFRHGSKTGRLAVGEVCTRDPLTVSPLATIPEVARKMVDRTVTSALIVDDGVLVGIFTSVDALQVLADA